MAVQDVKLAKDLLHSKETIIKSIAPVHLVQQTTSRVGVHPLVVNSIDTIIEAKATSPCEHVHLVSSFAMASEISETWGANPPSLIE